MKRALITGISGQDGYYMSEFLLKKKYEVHGIIRRNSQNSIGNLQYLKNKEKINIHWGDITDTTFISNLIKKLQPQEVYHLAAQSFVKFSFENPEYTLYTNILGTLNIVNAIKEHSPKSKMYFAGSSEQFGETKEKPQNENTPFNPRSPYGVSKVAGYYIVKNYRESYNLFLSNGLSFNHESPFRGTEFVTKKICEAIKAHDVLELGNLDAKRDWGFSGDFVEGFWKILQYKKPDDFVLATGEQHSVREFVEEAYKIVGIKIKWKGKGINEKGYWKNRLLVEVNPKFYRPAEVNNLVGDYSKAKKLLHWKPKIKFKELVKLMMEDEN